MTATDESTGLELSPFEQKSQRPTEWPVASPLTLHLFLIFDFWSMRQKCIKNMSLLFNSDGFFNFLWNLAKLSDQRPNLSW